MGFFSFLYNRKHIKPINQSSISGNGMLLNQSVQRPSRKDEEFSDELSEGFSGDDETDKGE